MKLNIFGTPVLCPACRNWRSKRDACTSCGGTGWLSLRDWLDALSDGALQEIAEEAQAILNERGVSADMLTADEAAVLKGVHLQTLRAILGNEARRAKEFPGARKTGVGSRGVWQIPRKQVLKWTPRKDRRREE